MGWYSNWTVEFRRNENGESIENLWDQEEVDKLLQNEQYLITSYDGHGNEAVFTIKYGRECPGLDKLWELYKCPMRVTCTDNDGHNEIYMKPGFCPSEFEWEFDPEVEKMIDTVCKTENITMCYDTYSYTREDRYKVLAKAMFDIHYKSK